MSKRKKGIGRTLWFAFQVLVTAFLMLWVAAAKADTIRLVVFAGQSNIGNSAVAPDLLPPELAVAPDIRYQYRLKDPYVSTEWGPLETIQKPSGSQVHASEMTFGHQTANVLQQDNFAIIKVSQGGTNLRTHWNPGTVGGLYDMMIDFIDDAITQLEDEGHSVEPAAFVWIQGSGDAGQLSAAEAYDKRLAELIGAVRDDLGSPDLPIIFNQFHVDALRTYTDELRASQARFAAADANAIMVNIDDLALRDSVHWAQPTHIEAGYRLSDAFLRHELILSETGKLTHNTVTAIPEPSTFALTLLALSLLLCCRRMGSPKLR